MLLIFTGLLSHLRIGMHSFPGMWSVSEFLAVANNEQLKTLSCRISFPISSRNDYASYLFRRKLCIKTSNRPMKPQSFGLLHFLAWCHRLLQCRRIWQPLSWTNRSMVVSGRSTPAKPTSTNYKPSGSHRNKLRLGYNSFINSGFGYFLKKLKYLFMCIAKSSWRAMYYLLSNKVWFIGSRKVQRLVHTLPTLTNQL